ncbi:MAG: zf-TFIIB domain-containing protein [Rhodospirillaceae bacterium]
MKCPIDEETLVIADRSGVEIDYCPKCRGVWLDRGELDKIIDRAAAQSAPEQRTPAPRGGNDDRDGYGESRKPYRKKKESFLGELFDF